MFHRICAKCSNNYVDYPTRPFYAGPKCPKCGCVELAELPKDNRIFLGGRVVKDEHIAARRRMEEFMHSPRFQKGVKEGTYNDESTAEGARESFHNESETLELGKRELEKDGYTFKEDGSLAGAPCS